MSDELRRACRSMTNEQKLKLLPKCPVCGRPILYSDTYLLWAGDRIHTDCFEKPTEDDLYRFVPKEDDFWLAVMEGEITDGK